MATVLVVDDVGGKTHALTRELTQLGYEVVSAPAGGAGGMEAVSVAETWRPDVVLLDVAMSQMDAIEACRRLRAVPVLQSTPIILVSSREEEPRLVSGLQAGAFDCITRPFSSTVLSARVRSAVRMKRALETIQATARLRSDLLQTASDELGTPVAAILDLTDNLLGPDRAQEQRRRGDAGVRLTGRRILVAEDDRSTQESLSRVLTNAGAAVTVAVSGPAATSLALAVDAAGRSFDAIVIGMHLAALGGEPAVEILRQRGYCGTILGLTPAVSAAERERCLGAGCNDVVIKPVDATAFLVAIGHRLDSEVSPNPGVVHATEGV